MSFFLIARIIKVDVIGKGYPTDNPYRLYSEQKEMEVMFLRLHRREAA